MKNKIQEAHNPLVLIAPAALAPGEPFMVGSIFAVAQGAAESGAPVVAEVGGVFDLPKVSGGIDAGDRLYWNASEKKLTKTAAGNKLVASAVAAAASGDATVRTYVGILSVDGPAE